jgi:hypothetical protein
VVAALPPWFKIGPEETHAFAATHIDRDENGHRLRGGAARQQL